MTNARAVAVVAAVTVAIALYVFTQPRAHPLADLKRGQYSDHASHVTAVRAFVSRGVVPWTTPLAGALPRLSEAAWQQRPADFANVPRDGELFDCGDGRPCSSNWSEHPRPYPPGSLLVAAPVAFASQLFDLGYQTTNRLFICWLGLFVGVLAALLWRAHRHVEAVLASLVVFVEAVHWSLNGFYDVVALTTVVLAVAAARERRDLHVVGWLSLGFFLHFRVVWFLPLGIAAAGRLVANRAWLRWSSREKLTALASLGAMLSSGGTLLVLAPALRTFPLHNPLAPSGWSGVHNGLVALAAVFVVICVHHRAWLDAAMGVWCVVLVMALQQAFPWHSLLLLPWLLLGPAGQSSLVVQGRWLLVVAISASIENPLLPGWLGALW
jgi:hypothetical protein